MFIIKCPICGEPTDLTKGICIYLGESRCNNPECYKKAKEWHLKKEKIMMDFSDEKERLLRPTRDKLDADLFLLNKEYLKGKINV